MPPTPSPPGERTVPVLLRFVSCGVLCLITGLVWRLSRPGAKVGVLGSLGDILALLSGFILAGALWYVRDVRLARRHPERISDESIVFSFLVFVVCPLAVLLVIGLIWVTALLIGAG